MSELTLSEFVVTVVTFLVIGFCAGVEFCQWRERRRLISQFRRFQTGAGDDRVDALPKARPFSRWQMEQARQMQNSYGTDWHPEPLSELISKLALALYLESKPTEEKPD